MFRSPATPTLLASAGLRGGELVVVRPQGQNVRRAKYKHYGRAEVQQAGGPTQPSSNTVSMGDLP